MTSKNVLPFSLDDLIVKEDYRVNVYPENQHWLSSMRDRASQHPEDLKPAEKLMQTLKELDKDVYGFTLPRKSCLFVSERNLIKKQASARNEAILNYARLCQKISKSLKKPINQIQNMLREPFKHMESLDSWMEEITDSLTSLEATDMGFATVTVIIQQRLLPTWTEYDTLALPESLFNIILDYTSNEQNAWAVIEGEFVDEDEFEGKSDETIQSAIAPSQNLLEN